MSKGQLNKSKIILKKDEVTACFQFAEEAWEFQSQSKKHFGDGKRSKEEFLADQTEGKLAELVLMKFLKEEGLIVNLDFNHYEGEHNTDKGDFKILSHDKLIEAAVDVKGSSQYAQWLLVEDYKFIDYNTGKLRSNAFVMVCFGDTFPGNKALRKEPKLILNNEYEAEVMGWAMAEDFYEPGKNTFWFEWGQRSQPWNKKVLPKSIPYNRKGLENYLNISVPNTEKPKLSLVLDAKMNYGLPIKWLRKDWKEFISFVLK
ncbi:hypothetical protein [Priestia megaterium]|uniref:hypothetical protein n=1 Tax=Priestia megaterium TaxID=1404 RepID=UPI003009E272